MPFPQLREGYSVNCFQRQAPLMALRNQKGNSLVMVMIAAAVGMILAVGMASLMTNMQLSANNVQFRSDAGNLNEEIRALLSSPIACAKSFGPGSPTGAYAAVAGASYNIATLYNGPIPPPLPALPPPPVATYIAGNTYGSGNSTTILTSMTLTYTNPGRNPSSIKWASSPRMLKRWRRSLSRQKK